MATKRKQAAFLLTGIPKGALHNLLHRWLMAEVEAGAYEGPPATDDGRQVRRQQTTDNGLQKYKSPTTDNRRLYQHYKNYCLLNRLKSRALSLLKTLYAKKPKNPT